MEFDLLLLVESLDNVPLEKSQLQKRPSKAFCRDICRDGFPVDYIFVVIENEKTKRPTFRRAACFLICPKLRQYLLISFWS